MTTENYNLEERQIINYLRKNASNKENQNNIRNKLLSLFYKTINDIPITIKIDIDKSRELLKDYPLYFQLKTREEIIDLFNSAVCPKKPINYNHNRMDYDIKDDSYLEISNRTFRPFYVNNWKEQTKIMNGVGVENQDSFYMEYLRYYLKYKRFPDFNEYLNYIYYKFKRPVHKDIRIVFDNIEKSYESIKEYIKKNDLTYKEVKLILIKSTGINNRKEMQALNINSHHKSLY